jgi:hypothetical protein
MNRKLSTVAITLSFLAGCSSSEPGGSTGTGGTSGSGNASGGHTTSGGTAGNGGGGALSAASDELCGERPSGKITATHVLRFENADRSVVVQLKRTWEDSAPGESSLYRLDAFALSLDGQAICVTDPSRLQYVNTHHNWSDSARADSPTARYEFNLRFDEPATIGGVAPNGAVVLETTDLIPTGGPPFCWSCPSNIPVSISEVMLRNVSTHADEAGEFEPWIELYNPSAGDVNLSGWTLSDDFMRREKWPLPAVTILRHQTLLVFADGDAAQGERHASFRLLPAGTELVLTAPDGRTDGGTLFSAQPEGKSAAYQWAAQNYVIGNPTPNVPPEE